MKIGVSFPASSRETRLSDIVDICRWYQMLGFDSIRFVNNGGLGDARDIPGVTVVEDLRRRCQSSIMTNSLHAMSDCDWLLINDSDEWLWPVSEEDVRDWLAAAPANCGALMLNWITFGNTDQDRFVSCPEACVRRPPLDAVINRHCKAFVRRAAATKFGHVHFPDLRPGFIYCDENYKQLSQVKGFKYAMKPFSAERFALAHLHAKSVSESVAKEQATTLDRDSVRQPGSISVGFLGGCTILDTSFRDCWLSYNERMSGV